jgi:hypothetical protein
MGREIGRKSTVGFQNRSYFTKIKGFLRRLESHRKTVAQ